MHEKADSGRREMLRGRAAGTRVERAVPLRSFRVGVWGKADVVEFPREEPDGAGGHPRPVEYKRGKPKRDGSDAVQLCAQALCLEEMLGVEVPVGHLFYGQTRRREEIPIDAALRQRTVEAAERMHELMRQGITPPAALMKKCARCSMLHLCQPKAIGRRAGQSRSAAAYAERALAAAWRDPEVHSV